MAAVGEVVPSKEEGGEVGTGVSEQQHMVILICREEVA